jgi:hypothetical protein
MRKTVLGICIVTLAMPASVLGASFWSGFVLNYSDHSTGPSTQYNSTPGGQASGVQYATASGVTGSGFVRQGQGGVGYQSNDTSSQEQGAFGGQGQVVYNDGQGEASGTQSGYIHQAQTSTTGSTTAIQSQVITGTQSAVVTGAASGSSGAVVQTSSAQVYQYQSY